MRQLKEQRGSVAVLTALTMITLLAMSALVLDVGQMYLERIRLSNAVDAAVLAGVQKLPTTPEQAMADARQYAGMNDIGPGTMITATVESFGGVSNTRLSVSAIQPVDMTFARILGINQTNVTASAAAVVRSYGGGTGIVPFGVVWQEFVRNQTYTLKAGAGPRPTGSPYHHGNFGALAIGGTGANTYEDNIKFGSKETVSVGDWELTKPGNMSGPTNAGVNYRIGLDPTATYDNVREGSPRIIIVPIIASLEVNGRGYVQVIDFAAFFLEGTLGTGNDNYVLGRFREMYVAKGDPGVGGQFDVYTAELIR